MFYLWDKGSVKYQRHKNVHWRRNVSTLVSNKYIIREFMMSKQQTTSSKDLETNKTKEA